MEFDRQFNLFRRQVDRMFDDFNHQFGTGLLMPTAFPTVLPLLPFEETMVVTTPASGSGKASQQQQQQLQAQSQQGQQSQPQQQQLATQGASQLAPFGGMSGAFGMQPIKVDVVQEKDSYVVLAEVPGVNKEELKVQLKDDVLTISGERKHEVRDEDTSRKYVRVERSYGNFSRSLRLPQGCDTHNVSAKHENGVLKVSIPYRPEVKEEKHIAIA